MNLYCCLFRDALLTWLVVVFLRKSERSSFFQFERLPTILPIACALCSAQQHSIYFERVTILLANTARWLKFHCLVKINTVFSFCCFFFYNSYECQILPNMRWHIILTINYHSFWSKNTLRSLSKKIPKFNKIFKFLGAWGTHKHKFFFKKIVPKLFFMKWHYLNVFRHKSFKSW